MVQVGVNNKSTKKCLCKYIYFGKILNKQLYSFAKNKDNTEMSCSTYCQKSS